MSLIIRWAFYEVVLLIGFGAANFIYKILKLKVVAMIDAPSGLFFSSCGLLLVSIVHQNLKTSTAFRLELSIVIFTLLFLLGLISFQIALTIAVLLSTAYLYESYPFALNRWARFFEVKYALDASAIFVLGLFLSWGNVGAPFLILFSAFYLFLWLVRVTILKRFSCLQNNP